MDVPQIVDTRHSAVLPYLIPGVGCLGWVQALGGSLSFPSQPLGLMFCLVSTMSSSIVSHMAHAAYQSHILPRTLPSSYLEDLCSGKNVEIL